jgi:hypothetical protein
MPFMIAELVTAVYLVSINSRVILIINLMIVIVIWPVTFSLSMPCHRALANGKCLKTIHKLIVTNWLRTMLWSIKGVLLTAYISSRLKV